MRRAPVLTFTRKGIYCPAGDFYIDPWRPVDRALITHGHADHISGGPALAERTGAPYHLHPYDAIHPIDVMPARLSSDWFRLLTTLTRLVFTLVTVLLRLGSSSTSSSSSCSGSSSSG